MYIYIKSKISLTKFRLQGILADLHEGGCGDEDMKGIRETYRLSSLATTSANIPNKVMTRGFWSYEIEQFFRVTWPALWVLLCLLNKQFCHSFLVSSFLSLSDISIRERHKYCWPIMEVPTTHIFFMEFYYPSKLFLSGINISLKCHNYYKIKAMQ